MPVQPDVSAARPSTPAPPASTTLAEHTLTLPVRDCGENHQLFVWHLGFEELGPRGARCRRYRAGEVVIALEEGSPATIAAARQAGPWVLLAAPERCQRIARSLRSAGVPVERTRYADSPAFLLRTPDGHALVVAARA